MLRSVKGNDDLLHMLEKIYTHTGVKMHLKALPVLVKPHFLDKDSQASLTVPLVYPGESIKVEILDDVTFRLEVHRLRRYGRELHKPVIFYRLTNEKAVLLFAADRELVKAIRRSFLGILHPQLLGIGVDDKKLTRVLHEFHQIFGEEQVAAEKDKFDSRRLTWHSVRIVAENGTQRLSGRIYRNGEMKLLAGSPEILFRCMILPVLEEEEKRQSFFTRPQKAVGYEPLVLSFKNPFTKPDFANLHDALASENEARFLVSILETGNPFFLAKVNDPLGASQYFISATGRKLKITPVKFEPDSLRALYDLVTSVVGKPANGA